MSADTTAREALISDRLDGLLDDAAWQQALAEHGPELAEELAAAEALRQWCRSDPLPALPPLQLPPAPPPLEETAAPPTAPIPGPGSVTWMWLAAAGVAAGLIAITLPLWLYREGDHHHLTLARQYEPESIPSHGRMQALPQEPAAQRLEATLDASGLSFSLDEESKTARAPSSAPAYRSAPAPASPQPTRITEEESSMEAADNDAVLEALAAEARTFRHRHGDLQVLSDAGPLPESVVDQVVAAEARAEAAVRDRPAAEARVRLQLDLGISQDDAGIPTGAVISLRNRGEIAAPLVPLGLLRLEGLDAEGTVVWSLPLSGPADHLPPGEDWQWTAALGADLAPPANVTHTRLRYGPLSSEARPWIKAPSND
ncbi:MAG: hypothetical protein EA402_07785 [Planctomycetota bacterium]|nr:MAG: hypothetical protein EA402_07785 [Planctomycetota bacterium]